MISRDDHHYVVTWEIDIFASSPEEAARQALEMQRDPNSQATHFTVIDCEDPDRRSSQVSVDFDEEATES